MGVVDMDLLVVDVQLERVNNCNLIRIVINITINSSDE